MAIAGLSWAVATPLHPSIFEGDIAGVVQRTDAWVAIHLLVLVGAALAVVGAAGIVAAHDGELGWLGDATLVAIAVGGALTAGIVLVEAVAFPELATRAPELLELDGPMLRSAAVVLAVGLAGLYPVGLGVLGLLAARASLAPTAGRWLAATTVAFLVLAGPFVPVVGVLATFAYAGVHLWWAGIVWTASDVRPSASTAIEPELDGAAA